MMINNRVRYGLKTFLDKVENVEIDGVLQKEVCERQGISFQYLDSIISSHKAKGIFSNEAGKSSGYKLPKDPENISVYDVHTAFDPDLYNIHCICGESNCDRADRYPARNFWCLLNKSIGQIKKSTSLADIIHGNYTSGNKLLNLKT